MNPLVMLDEGVAFGKALQVYIGDKSYLVVGNGSRMHQDMLKIFLADNNVPFNVELLNGPNFGPAAEGENYRLVGAGWADLHYSDRIELSGHSGSYRISPDKEHAQEISDLLPKRVEIKKSKPVVIKRDEKPDSDLDDIIPF